MAYKIVMLGAPGAGKGTQAKRIADRDSVPHISTGDIFRAHLQEGTEIGKQVQQYLDTGQLVPDELTCRIVADRLSEVDCAEGYVLDGFPRSVPQAETLQDLLDERGDKLDVAIDIAVPGDEIVGRLTARRTCPDCGAIYNLKFGAPARAGYCDNCAEVELIQRTDDCEETILERLRVYHEITEPIIEFYGKHGLLETVSESGGPDEVFKRVVEIISSIAEA